MSLKDLSPVVWSYTKKTKFQKWEEMVNKLEDLIDTSKKTYETVGKKMIDEKEQFEDKILNELIIRLKSTQTHEINIPGSEIIRIIKAKFNALIQIIPCLSESNLGQVNIKFFHPKLNKIFKYLQPDNMFQNKVQYNFNLELLEKIYKKDKHNLNYAPQYLALQGYIQSQQDDYDKIVSLQKMKQQNIKIAITRKAMPNIKKQQLAIQLRNPVAINEKLVSPTEMILGRKQVKNNRTYVQKQKLKGNEEKKADLVFNMLLCCIHLGMINSLASVVTLEQFWKNFGLREAEIIMRGLIIGNLYSLIKDKKISGQETEFNGNQQDVFDEIMNIFEGIFVIGCEQQPYLIAIAQQISKRIDKQMKENVSNRQLNINILTRQIISKNWALQ